MDLGCDRDINQITIQNTPVTKLATEGFKISASKDVAGPFTIISSPGIAFPDPESLSQIFGPQKMQILDLQPSISAKYLKFEVTSIFDQGLTGGLQYFGINW